MSLTVLAGRLLGASFCAAGAVQAALAWAEQPHDAQGFALGLGGLAGGVTLLLLAGMLDALQALAGTRAEAPAPRAGTPGRERLVLTHGATLGEQAALEIEAAGGAIGEVEAVARARRALAGRHG